MIAYADELVTLHHADSLAELAWLTADVLITDPPYGRAWKRGDTGTARGWVSDAHEGIANDANTDDRDAVLALWGSRPAIVFGDLMLEPPAATKQVLIWDKGDALGFTGAVGGYRRNVEGIYLLGGHGTGLGGRSAILTCANGTGARGTGHPHAKPLDLMGRLILNAPPGVVADPFAGSGSTLVAAKLAGRKAIGVEVDAAYCQLAAKRLTQDALFEGAGT